jgi:hypothetical protein
MLSQVSNTILTKWVDESSSKSSLKIAVSLKCSEFCSNTQFDPSHVRSEESLRCLLGGSYYTCALFCPDFEAIRKGVIIIVECGG